jgi:hypothetical protein
LPDVKIVHPCGASQIQGGSWQIPGKATLNIETAKSRAFELLRPQISRRVHFCPIVIDTYSGVGGQFNQLIRGAAALRAQQTAGTMSDKRAASATRAVHKSFMVDLSCRLQHELVAYFTARAEACT